jgi:hypothetical protein
MQQEHAADDITRKHATRACRGRHHSQARNKSMPRATPPASMQQEHAAGGMKGASEEMLMKGFTTRDENGVCLKSYVVTIL